MPQSSPSDAARPLDGRAVSPVTVFVLNLLLGACAGYFQIGQKQKAWTALVVFVLIATPTWCAGSLLLSLVAAVDGYLQASELEAGRRIGPWTMFRQSASLPPS